MTKSKNILPPRRVWTEGELELLKRRYPDDGAEDIAEALGCKVHIVYKKAAQLGLKKSSAFKSSAASGRLDGVRGADTRFKKGNVPWSKGTHFVAGGRSAETRFKAGIVPHNIVPVGTTVMATQGYFKTKVAEPNKWRWTHRMKWEEANGPIPKEMMLVFKDGIKAHCELSNLELITRQEHIARHTIHNLPPELKQLIQLNGALKRRINHHGK